MDDQLMLGILLIIVGIALALIAVAVVLNRREDRREAEERIKNAEGDSGEGDSVEDSEEDLEESDLVAETIEGEEEETPAEASAKEVEPTPRGEAAPPLERLMVAEIYREEVTGELIVQLGDEEFRAGERISNERDLRRLSAAASDLVEWLEPRREMPGPRLPETAKPRDPADQMLVQINEILQRSLAEAETSERGVRLIPDASGGVRVLIGVKSYELDEVPDKDIKGLIREAVAEWEAAQ